MFNANTINRCRIWIYVPGVLLIQVLHCQRIQAEIDFARDVKPILQQHCVECHNPTLKMGQLELTSREAMLAAEVVTPSDPASSLLLQRLHDRDLGILMPPTGRLSKEEIEQLKAWVESGSVWPNDILIKAESDYEPDFPKTGIFQVLRNADDHQLSKANLNSATLSQTDRRGATPLIYAAYYASPQSVQRLLRAGADPNAADSDGLTPLMLAIADLEKVRLLIQHGARVEAETKLGRRAILLASAHAGNTEVVRELHQAGADLHFADRRGWTPISLAARTGDHSLLREILGRLDQNQSKHPKMIGKAIGESARANDLEAVRLLLKANSTHDQTSLDRALVFAATHGNLEMTNYLIDAGANANSSSPTKFATPASPFLSAAYSENQNQRVVKRLLTPDINIQQQEKHGKTALTMAREHGSNQLAQWLLQSGATESGLSRPNASTNQSETKGRIAASTDPNRIVAERQIVSILQKSTELLQSCDLTFFAKSGCVACHQQTASALVVSMARPNGIAIDDRTWRQQVKLTSVELAKKRAGFLQRIKSGGAAHRFGYLLWGLSASGYPADEFTDATCYELAGLQRLDGSWLSDAHRPPTEYSSITATAVAMRALHHYAPPGWRASTQRRISRATQWLAQQHPKHNAEKAFQLLGLHWGHATPEQISMAAQHLLRDQSTTGGWSQRRGLDADAYATGLTLYALHESGKVASNDDVYQRGVRFLANTVAEDGSWYVASRSFKFQPYFESGFPYGPDQWISAAATGWSSLALLNTLLPQTGKNAD